MVVCRLEVHRYCFIHWRINIRNMHLGINIIAMDVNMDEAIIEYNLFLIGKG